MAQSKEQIKAERVKEKLREKERERETEREGEKRERRTEASPSELHLMLPICRSSALLLPSVAAPPLAPQPRLLSWADI